MATTSEPRTQQGSRSELPGRSRPAWPWRPAPAHPSRPCSNIPGRCPPVCRTDSFSRTTAPAASPKAPHGHRAAHRGHLLTDVHAWPKRGAEGRGHLPHSLFLILPFLAPAAPLPKAPRRSSWAWRRPRADSCRRPPRCRKRIFCARRRCFRICCLVLSSERTRPAGAPGAPGLEAPAGTGSRGAQALGDSQGLLLPEASRLPPCPHTHCVRCCGPSLWHTVGA